MKEKTKADKESAKMELENQEELEILRNQNFSLQELHNLKDEAYYRVSVLNSLNRIAQVIENLALSEDSSKEESEEKKE